MTNSAEIALLRAHDPARGSFIPEPREPIMDRESNPRGVRHPFKTKQDSMPVHDRPRVIEAERLHNKRRAASEAA